MFKMYSKNHTQHFFSWIHFKTDVQDQGKTPACITSICMYHITHGSTSFVGRALGCREESHRFNSQAQTNTQGLKIN